MEDGLWARFMISIGGVDAVARKIVDTASQRANWVLGYSERERLVNLEEADLLAIPVQNITAQTIENEINDFVVVFNQERIDRHEQHDAELFDINLDEERWDRREERMYREANARRQRDAVLQRERIRERDATGEDSGESMDESMEESE